MYSAIRCFSTSELARRRNKEWLYFLDCVMIARREQGEHSIPACIRDGTRSLLLNFLKAAGLPLATPLSTAPQVAQCAFCGGRKP